MRTSTLLLLWLVTTACAGDPLMLEREPVPNATTADLRPALGATFALRAGEVASVADAGLLVTFGGVRHDSRCPMDVTCVWAGDAEVRIGVALEPASWSWSALHTGVEPRGLSAGGFAVEVVGLEPAIRTGLPLPSDYTVLLRITPETLPARVPPDRHVGADGPAGS